MWDTSDTNVPKDVLSVSTFFLRPTPAALFLKRNSAHPLFLMPNLASNPLPRFRHTDAPGHFVYLFVHLFPLQRACTLAPHFTDCPECCLLGFLPCPRRACASHILRCATSARRLLQPRMAQTCCPFIQCGTSFSAQLRLSHSPSGAAYAGRWTSAMQCHTTSTTPPTARIVLVLLFTMVVSDPAKNNFHEEHLAVCAHMRESDRATIFHVQL